MGLSRGAYRHVSQASELNVGLRQEIVAIAHQRRRWGYRMIHDVLRPRYPNVGHKPVYRRNTTEGLSIRKRIKTKSIGVRLPLSGCSCRQSDLEH